MTSRPAGVNGALGSRGMKRTDGCVPLRHTHSRTHNLARGAGADESHFFGKYAVANATSDRRHSGEVWQKGNVWKVGRGAALILKKRKKKPGASPEVEWPALPSEST